MEAKNVFEMKENDGENSCNKVKELFEIICEKPRQESVRIRFKGGVWETQHMFFNY